MPKNVAYIERTDKSPEWREIRFPVDHGRGSVTGARVSVTFVEMVRTDYLLEGDASSEDSDSSCFLILT